MFATADTINPEHRTVFGTKSNDKSEWRDTPNIFLVFSTTLFRVSLKYLYSALKLGIVLGEGVQGGGILFALTSKHLSAGYRLYRVEF